MASAEYVMTIRVRGNADQLTELMSDVARQADGLDQFDLIEVDIRPPDAQPFK